MQSNALTQPAAGTTRFSTTTRLGKLVEVDSPYTDTEARQIISDAPDKSDFEKSLLQATRLSYSQRVWVHVCAVRRTTNAEKPKQQGIDLGAKFERIVQMFAKAGQTLQYPKVHLATDEGQTVQLHVFGANSRYTGQVCVKYDCANYIGRIDKDGSFYAKEPAASVVKLLREFASKPEETAAAYGKLTGNCCFCHRKLTDPRSTEVGYGPVCADRFGLIWG